MTFVFSAEVRNNIRGYQAVVLPTNLANYMRPGLVGNFTVANRGSADCLVFVTATAPEIPEGPLTADQLKAALAVLEPLKLVSVPCNEALVGMSMDWLSLADFNWVTIVTRTSNAPGLDLYVQLVEQVIPGVIA